MRGWCSTLAASASSTFHCARRRCTSIAFSLVLSERSIRSHKLFASVTKSLSALLLRCLFQLVFPPVHAYYPNRFRRNKRLIVSAGLVQEVIVHTAPPMHISKSKIHSPFRSRDEEELNYGVLGGMKCTVSYEKLMTQ